MTSTNISIDQYLSLPNEKRVAHICALTNQRALSENFFLAALPVEHNALARWHVIKALGLCKSTASIPSLLQVCKAPDVDFGNTSVHAICAWSLGQIGVASFDPVMTLFAGGDGSTRRCVLDALGEIRDTRGIEPLCFALEHDEYAVKLVCGLSLAKIGEEAVPAVERVLNRADPVTRIIALDAIAKVNSTRSLSILEKLLLKGSVEDKKLILRSGEKWFGALSNRIEPLTNDSDVELSTLARRALKEIRRRTN
jgi:HEAT repeat protein